MGVSGHDRNKYPAREPPRPALAGPDTGCLLKMSVWGVGRSPTKNPPACGVVTREK